MVSVLYAKSYFKEAKDCRVRTDTAITTFVRRFSIGNEARLRYLFIFRRTAGGRAVAMNVCVQ